MLQASGWVFPMAVDDRHLKASIARRHAVNFCDWGMPRTGKPAGIPTSQCSHITTTQNYGLNDMTTTVVLYSLQILIEYIFSFFNKPK